MNCHDCLEAQTLDGIIPGCKTDEGCLIPPLHPMAARVMEVRDKLTRLRRLKIGGHILSIYGCTVDDLELLAVAEDELYAKEDMPDGDGSEMDTEC